MLHFSFTIRSSDGLSLFAREWRPEESPRGLVCLVHGIGEHSGRYDHVAAALGRAGVALLGFDHRGHGRSQGQRGHTPSYDTIMDDIGGLLAEGARRYPGLPTVIYGHSMGGNFTLNYVLRRRPRLAGAVVTSPWLRLAFQPSRVKVRLGRLMYRVWPSFAQHADPMEDAISRDPAMLEQRAGDPLVHDWVTPKLFFDTYDAGLWALEHASEFPLPLLLMHGTGDRITSWEASREFAARAHDCTFRAWEGFYHETHNEPEGAQVIAAIVAWVAQRVEAAGPGPAGG